MTKVHLLGIDAVRCDNFWERARGLIARPAPAPGTGLLIPKCNAIHTLFMTYPIDATFLDGHGEIVKVIRKLRPWRLWVWGGWRARSVLETASCCSRAVGNVL